MKAQLGNLYNLVREHGSLADAVQASLTSGGLVQGDFSDLRIEMDSFSEVIQVFADSAKMSSETVISINSRIREKLNSRHQAMRSRLKLLEATVDAACGMPPTLAPFNAEVLFSRKHDVQRNWGPQRRYTSRGRIGWGM